MKRRILFVCFSLALLTAACGGKEKSEKEAAMASAEMTEGLKNEKESEEQREETENSGSDAETANADIPAAPSMPPTTPAPVGEIPLPSAETAPKNADPAASQAEKIQHIRDVYGRTVQNQDGYRQSGGKYYTADGTLAKAVTSNGNPVLDEAMRKNGYSVYGVEYYYEDQPGGDNYPIFIYAIIDKKEYRYYFCYGQFIRRVGPEGGGNTNDSPEMNSFIQTLRDEGASYRLGASSLTPAPQLRQSLSHEEKIAYIQGIYERTERELSAYDSDGRYYYSDNYAQRITVSTGGNFTLDEVMRKNGYSTYTLTYYYDHQGSGEYYAGNPVLVHGYIDGKEYWYYFYDDEFIRRVGPEGGGNTNDSPTSNSFIETIKSEGGYLGVVCPA